MREVFNTGPTLASTKASAALQISAHQVQERCRYAQVQISGTIQALDQILAVAIEQRCLKAAQVTEAAEVLDIALDAVRQLASGINDLAEAFLNARGMLVVTQDPN